ncbi:MAG: efflux transporter periplasmic adaptor subunit [Sphingobium sp. 32-64-5]|nr:MAG: efflux transporter periplasmic adaptor subunit [Sphingobium sp. 32-64-5]
MNYESGFSGDSLTADPSRLSSRRKTIALVAAGLVLLVIILAWWMKGADTAPQTDAEMAAPRVTVIVPGVVNVSTVVNAVGTLAARREMPVGVVGDGGEVSAVLVEAGQWVKAGQVLARVERSVQVEQRASLAASLKVAQADARLAQNELVAARVNVARAQLGEQQARIGRLDIRAPADGLVLTRAVEQGQVIGAGSGVLFRMAKGGEMELLARVGETDLAHLSVGASASVTPVGGRQSYDGRVWQISSVIDPQTRQGDARIALAYHRDLRPGGFAAARIVSGAAQAPVLPESAIQNDDKGSYVFIVNGNNVVERRDVRVGQVAASGVPVLEGLTGKEKVVILAGGFLSAGQKVEPEVQKADDRRGAGG